MVSWCEEIAVEKRENRQRRAAAAITRQHPQRVVGLRPDQDTGLVRRDGVRPALAPRAVQPHRDRRLLAVTSLRRGVDAARWLQASNRQQHYVPRAEPDPPADPTSAAP